MKSVIIAPEYCINCPQESGAYLPVDADRARRRGLGPRQTQVGYGRSRTDDVVGWEERVVRRSIMGNQFTNSRKRLANLPEGDCHGQIGITRDCPLSS
jgi:hypothetical protein